MAHTATTRPATTILVKGWDLGVDRGAIIRSAELVNVSTMTTATPARARVDSTHLRRVIRRELGLLRANSPAGTRARLCARATERVTWLFNAAAEV